MLYLLFNKKLQAWHKGRVITNIDKIFTYFQKSKEIVISDLDCLGYLAKEKGSYQEYRKYQDVFWIMRIGKARIRAKKINRSVSLIFAGKKKIYDMTKLAYHFLDLKTPTWSNLQSLREDFEKIRKMYEEMRLNFPLYKITTIGSLAKYIWKQIYSDYKPERNFRYEQLFKRAYYGGLILDFYRGFAKDVVYLDFEKLYYNIQKKLQVEKYRNYRLKRAKELNFDRPQICGIWVNFGYIKNKQGYFLNKFKEPKLMILFNYDIKALERLYNDFQYKIEWIFDVLPKGDYRGAVEKAFQLPYLGKKLVNSMYGMYAQTKPRRTKTTNLCIAGMITAFARYKLTELMDFYRQNGIPVYYMDTDSVMIPIKGYHLIDIYNRIDGFRVRPKNIANEALFLSARKYILWGQKNEASLYGKWAYDITEDMLIELGEIMKEQGKIAISSNFIYAKITKTSNSLPGDFPFQKTTVKLPALKRFIQMYFQHIDGKLGMPDEKGWRGFEEYSIDNLIGFKQIEKNLDVWETHLTKT
ncbi:hypothetical protein J7M02_02645 [Candidatus Aerophobetes bacterium]|nr:hypothetical protein [Candidatus Aerophobetes bacterium]